jgi:mannan endo-1,4-beta-mannosidase
MESQICQGLHTKGLLILDKYENTFIARGVNLPFAWYKNRSISALKDISAIGCNAVRIVLSSGDMFAKTEIDEVEAILHAADGEQITVILEVHDTTGYKESNEAVSLLTVVEYWATLLPILKGRENSVIINIGNEPYGNRAVEGWLEDTKKAIIELRTLGFTHLLMVDAPYWGQDTGGIMKRAEGKVLRADPLRNTCFSIHMYSNYQDSVVIEEYLNSFTQSPIVIGEFGHSTEYGDVDEISILRIAHNLNIGYMAWSWCGNNEANKHLDLVENWDKERLTPWGEIFFSSQYGILATE